MQTENRVMLRLELDELAEHYLSDDLYEPDAERFADYAVYKNGSGWVFNGNGLSEPSFEENLVVTDLEGNPLLAVTLQGGTVTEWRYS